MSDREELHVDVTERPGPPPPLRESGGGRSRAVGAFLATFALVAFAGVVWFAYDRGLQVGSEGAAPLITADERPVKIRPENAGGMEIPNQDRLVFDTLRSEEDRLPRVERLLPPPEEPKEPPAPPAAPPAAVPAPAAQEGGVPPVVIQQEPQAQTQPVESPQAAPQDDGIPPARVVAPAPAPKVPLAPQIAPQTAPQETVAAAPPPPPAPPPAPAAKEPTPAPAPAPTPPPAPAPAAPQSGSYYVQLAAVRSEEVARQEWNRLKRRYSGQLGSLDVRVQRIDLGAGKGVFYRVQGGRVSEASAREICDALKGQGQGCLVVGP